MKGKKRYNALDEIGFLGLQGKSKASVQKDIERTVQFIKDKKANKAGYLQPKKDRC